MIKTTPLATSKILMGYARGVGSTENGVSYTQTRASYTFDRIKTLVDSLENQICGVAVAGENNDRIDGRSPAPPCRGIPRLFVLA